MGRTTESDKRSGRDRPRELERNSEVEKRSARDRSEEPKRNSEGARDKPSRDLKRKRSRSRSDKRSTKEAVKEDNGSLTKINNRLLNLAQYENVLPVVEDQNGEKVKSKKAKKVKKSK